jgi:hypothetical protein
MLDCVYQLRCRPTTSRRHQWSATRPEYSFIDGVDGLDVSRPGSSTWKWKRVNTPQMVVSKFSSLCQIWRIVDTNCFEYFSSQLDRLTLRHLGNAWLRCSDNSDMRRFFVAGVYRSCAFGSNIPYRMLVHSRVSENGQFLSAKSVWNHSRRTWDHFLLHLHLETTAR